ncbi:MAG TPA: hypothetical protein VF101_03435 [Gaiellaceae bacterium]
MQGPHHRLHHRPALVALALAGAALAAQAAGAAGRAPLPVGLPSSTTPLTDAPPLRTNAVIFREEAAYRGALANDERVFVTIDGRGRAVGVRVVQRLTVLAKGDYTFVVPAPALDVAAGAGSESQPGLRRGAIVWRGFSPKRRRLVADARLQVDAAAPFLPFQVSVRATANGTTLAIENTTGVTTYAYSAEVARKDAAAALAGVRRAVRRGSDIPASSLTARTAPKLTTVRVFAPLRIDGELRARRGAAPKRFSAVLGDGGKTRLRIAFARRLPLLTLRVRPTPPARMLRDGRGDGRRLFDRAFAAIRTLARVRQFQQFLLNPDPIGRSHTVYVFRTGAAAAAAPRAESRREESSPATTIVVLVLAAAAVGGAAVLWAHS